MKTDLTPTLNDAPQRVFTKIAYPASWYYFASVKEMQQGPVTRELVGKHLVGFLTQSGQAGVLHNRCVHMGANLGGGCVVGESLQCSLHHWEFDCSGRCTKIPTTDEIPSFAKVQSYPAVIRHGNVYFFLGEKAAFPLPFFDGIDVDELVAAKPFVEFLECPWYMIGANAVDVQHFAIAHDRQLQRAPDVSYPGRWTHQTVCHFEIAGDSFGDRLTKRFGGTNVRLQINDWCSTIIFARSTLAKAETFGMICVVPLDSHRTMVHGTVMAHRSHTELARRLLDPLRAAIRRWLVHKFLSSDIDRLAGTQYSPHTLIDIDKQVSEYFDWLISIGRHETRR